MKRKIPILIGRRTTDHQETLDAYRRWLCQSVMDRSDGEQTSGVTKPGPVFRYDETTDEKKKWTRPRTGTCLNNQP